MAIPGSCAVIDREGIQEFARIAFGVNQIVFPFTRIGTCQFIEVEDTDGQALPSELFGLFNQFLTLKTSVPNCISCLVGKENRWLGGVQGDLLPKFLSQLLKVVDVQGSLLYC